MPRARAVLFALLVPVLLAGGSLSAVAQNLDTCLTVERDDGTRPICCVLAGVDRVKRDGRDCCSDAALDRAAPAAASTAPDLPAAPSQGVPVPRAAGHAAGDAIAGPGGEARERPPDRRPPTLTIVLRN